MATYLDRGVGACPYAVHPLGVAFKQLEVAGFDLYSYGLCIHGLYGYGLYGYGPCSYGLYSYGLL